LQILKDGHERFRSGRRLTRDLGRQVASTAEGQHPLAVVLSCIDSRTPTELIFDLGVGEMMSVRLAGNVLGDKALGSLEYCCAVAGTKLVLVMGHTRCGAVSAAVNLVNANESAAQATGCEHIDPIVEEIQQVIATTERHGIRELSATGMEIFVNEVARRNVRRVVETIRRQSATLNKLADEGRIAVIGAMYNVGTGNIEFLEEK
jgi:carbonic anhydrase/SulP family sulfate permease